jgi:sterol desaturase/sphingolipid hydroxylase (fatty acid hydroxylase superfamily)
MQALLDTAISFAILCAVFLPLERLFPAQRTRLFRAEWGIDLLFFLGQYLLWTAPVVAALVFVSERLERAPLEGLHGFVRAQPFWLQFLCAILISDVCIYWGHRFSHSNAILWRFHRVHHTAPHVDWLAAHREHPLDNLYTRLIENLPLIVLGFPLQTLAGFAMFRGLWAIYIHSNVSLSPGPLRYVLGAPRLHHGHHARTDGIGVNFANLSPLMDIAFGTFLDPRKMPEEYGTSEHLKHGYLSQMIAPFWTRSSTG